MTPSSPRPKRRLGRFIALLRVIGLGAIVATVIGVGLEQSAPAPMQVGAAPPDLDAEAISIPSPSGATLAAWFVAGRPGGGAVVLMHGVRGNRASMVRRARLFKS